MSYTFEHFDAGLPAAWTAITAGTGTVTVSDSKVIGALAAANDGAAIYKRFDQTRSQIVMLCGRTTVTGTGAMNPNPVISLVHGASAPICDTSANILDVARAASNVNSLLDYTRLRYTDTGAVNQNWNETGQVWATAGTTLSTPATVPRDDYRIQGFEWDAAGSRMRLFTLHTASGSAENADYGPRLVALTDWIALSAMRNGTSTTLWLVIGWQATELFIAANSWEVEWVSETWGAKVDVLCNGKATVGSKYNITHHTGYDLRAPFLLPGTRAAIAIPASTPTAFDDESTQWGSATLDDDGVYYASYSGNPAGGATTLGLATATTPGGTWTKQGQIIAAGGGGSTYEGGLTFNVLFKDWLEPDPARRYKMIAKGFNAALTVGTIILFDAPSRTGTFTYRGVLIPEDATETAIAYRGHPVWYRGNWHLFYNCTVGGAEVIRRQYGPRLEVGAFTKEAVTLSTSGANSAEQDVTAVSGRTITVASTTGFVKDALIVGTNSASADTYALSRVRKVLSATQLELYHAMPGLTTASQIRTANRGADNALNQVLRLDGVWCFVMTIFKSFTSHATFGAHHESNGLFIGGARPQDASAISWQAMPIAPLGRDAWNTTVSNENMRVILPTVKFAAGVPVRIRTAHTRR